MPEGRMVRWAAVLGMAMAVHAGSSRPARCEEGRVLVVGAGLAGLGAADALRRHGCDVTVLEASNLHGGTQLPDSAWPSMEFKHLHQPS